MYLSRLAGALSGGVACKKNVLVVTRQGGGFGIERAFA
jgi:hypothetical protein